MSLLLLTRQLVARSFSTAAKKMPTLHGESATDSKEKLTSVQVFSWGRRAFGQLGGGVEEVRMYPSPVANLYFSSSFSLSPTSGRLPLDAGEWVQVKFGIGEQIPTMSLAEEIKFLEDEDDLGPPTMLSVAVGASHAICMISRSSR